VINGALQPYRHDREIVYSFYLICFGINKLGIKHIIILTKSISGKRV